MSMTEDILALVNLHGGVTLGELERGVGGFRGDLPLFFDHDRNLVTWVNVSEEAVHALNQLVEEGRIVYRKTVFTLFNYGYDGDYIPLPLAERVRRYKEPRWLPLMVCAKGDKKAAKAPVRGRSLSKKHSQG
ncbi:MAG: hypothetical protein WAW37_19830 [Syntrophobacteraceae bacterium]